MRQLIISLTLILFGANAYGRDLSGCAVRCNTYLHEPVCAFNGKEYRMFQNKCLMLTENCGAENLWTQQSLSECDQGKHQQKRSVECPNICPMIYAPVCATNGKTNRVFASQCELDSVNCRSARRWITTRSSDCGQEAMYGTNEVGVYKNKSDVINAESPCPVICSYNASYVCGFNGEQYRIFGNECAFEMVKCRSKENWTLEAVSDCDGNDDWYFPAT